MFVIYVINTRLLAWGDFPSSGEGQTIDSPVWSRDVKTEKYGGCKSLGLEKLGPAEGEG